MKKEIVQDLNYWLDEVTVCTNDFDEHDWWPKALPYAVVHPEEGFIALFATERAALQHRMFVINEELNGKHWGIM